MKNILKMLKYAPWISIVRVCMNQKERRNLGLHAQIHVQYNAQAKYSIVMYSQRNSVIRN